MTTTRQCKITHGPTECPFVNFPDLPVGEVIETAQNMHACDEVEIDDSPEIIEADDGLWVASWVRVNITDIDQARLEAKPDAKADGLHG